MRVVEDQHVSEVLSQTHISSWTEIPTEQQSLTLYLCLEIRRNDDRLVYVHIFIYTVVPHVQMYSDSFKRLQN